MKQGFILLFTLVVINFLFAESTHAEASPDDFLDEYNYSGETSSYEIFNYNDKQFYLYKYCSSECTTIVFDPEKRCPLLDSDRSTILEIQKNYKVKDYVGNSELSEVTYSEFLTDFGADKAETCKLINYKDALVDTALVETEKFVITYVPYKKQAKTAIKIFNSLARVDKRNIVAIYLSINCFGEDKLLQSFVTNTQTAKQCISNLNNGDFYENQAELLFSSHQKICSDIKMQKFDLVKIGEDWISNNFKQLLGQNSSEFLMDKLNRWDKEYSSYLSEDIQASLYGSAEKETENSVNRLNSLRSDVETTIKTLTDEVNSEYSSWKNRAEIKQLLFDYNFSEVDAYISKINENKGLAEADKINYRYNSAKSKLGEGRSAFENAKIAKEDLNSQSPSLLKLIIWISLLLILFRKNHPKIATVLAIALLIIWFGITI